MCVCVCVCVCVLSELNMVVGAYTFNLLLFQCHSWERVEGVWQTVRHAICAHFHVQSAISVYTVKTAYTYLC